MSKMYLQKTSGMSTDTIMVMIDSKCNVILIISVTPGKVVHLKTEDTKKKNKQRKIYWNREPKNQH